jgi:hypothetical protein
MIGTTEVIIKNLQNMRAKSLPPTGARGRMEQEYQDWARLQGSPASGTTHGRTQRPPSGVADASVPRVRMCQW